MNLVTLLRNVPLRIQDVDDAAFVVVSVFDDHKQKKINDSEVLLEGSRKREKYLDYRKSSKPKTAKLGFRHKRVKLQKAS